MAKPRDDKRTKKQPPLIPRWLVITLAALVGVVFGAYLVRFWLIQGLPLGQPGAWGEFGDYIGGLLNPLVGLFSVTILVATLRKQQRQIDEIATQARVERLLEFAERVYRKLDRLLDGKVPIGIELGTRSAVSVRANGGLQLVMARKVLNSNSKTFPADVADRKLLSEILTEENISQWEFQQFGQLGRILAHVRELNRLVIAIQKEAKAPEVGNFYINRLISFTQAISALNYLTLTEMSAIQPNNTFTTPNEDGGTSLWLRNSHGEFEVVGEAPPGVIMTTTNAED